MRSDLSSKDLSSIPKSTHRGYKSVTTVSPQPIIAKLYGERQRPRGQLLMRSCVPWCLEGDRYINARLSRVPCTGESDSKACDGKSGRISNSRDLFEVRDLLRGKVLRFVVSSTRVTAPVDDGRLRNGRTTSDIRRNGSVWSRATNYVVSRW